MSDDLAAFLDAAEELPVRLRRYVRRDPSTTSIVFPPGDARAAGDALDALVRMVRAVLTPGQRGMPTSCGCPLRDALNGDSWDGHHDRYCGIAGWVHDAMLCTIPRTPTAGDDDD